MLPSVGAEHGVSSELLLGNPSGCPSPFDKGQLVAQRRAPKVPAGDLLDRTHLIGSEGSVPPSGRIPLQIVPSGLGNVLGYLGSVARASAM
jgi:hypothetical protein